MDNLDLDTILDRILHYAGELTPCDTASLMIVEDDMARVTHCYGFPDGEVTKILSIETSVSQTPNLREMAKTGDPLFIQNTRSFSGWREDILPEKTQFNS